VGLHNPAKRFRVPPVVLNAERIAITRPLRVHVGRRTHNLPRQCNLIGCRQPSAPKNAFCCAEHYEAAKKYCGGNCGFEWTR
jgi:hypothetical protein